LKDQILKSKEKRNDLCDQIQQKESQSMNDVHINQALKEITEECENIAKYNANLKHEMESMVMKFSKKNEENLVQTIKEKLDECNRVNDEVNQLYFELEQSGNNEVELER
jgi:Golgi nucleoside diphosphatase